MSKKFASLFVFMLVVSIIATACGSAVSAPVPTATPTIVPATPTATELPFGCYGDKPYLWVENEAGYPNVAVPYGQTVVYPYELNGLKWNATLKCDNPFNYSIGMPYGVVSDLPVVPTTPIITMTCDEGITTFKVSGADVPEMACNKSLIFGEDKTPPQISIRIKKGDLEMIFDLEFQIKQADTVNGPATYLDYLVWGGYPDTGEFADVRCEMVHPNEGLMGFGGGVTIKEPLAQYDAICGSEGFTIEMSLAGSK